MITEETYKQLKQMEEEKSFYKSVLFHMDSQYVRTGLGMVDHNHGVKSSDLAGEFGSYFKEYLQRKDEELKLEVEARINRIDSEISKHIKN